MKDVISLFRLDLGGEVTRPFREETLKMFARDFAESRVYTVEIRAAVRGFVRDTCVQRPRKTNFPAHISRFPKSIFLRNKLLICGHTADCKSPRVYRARFARVKRLTYRAVEIAGSTRGGEVGEEVLRRERTPLLRFNNNDHAGNALLALQRE